MSSLKVKYLKGWIGENIADPANIEKWLEQFEKAKTENLELVVFAIPNSIKGKMTVGTIEKLLQDNFGE